MPLKHGYKLYLISLISIKRSHKNKLSKVVGSFCSLLYSEGFIEKKPVSFAVNRFQLLLKKFDNVSKLSEYQPLIVALKV